MGSDVQQNLKSIFKLESFRPGQKEVVEAALAGRSSLVIMPTGFGKSLTYQLPATILQGTAIVLSPLKALMKDQVDRLRQLGIRAGYINSSLTKGEREERQSQLASGYFQILYVTPERFQKADLTAALQGVSIPLLVVDEAHCISQWGQDFRPEYAKVGEIHNLLKKPTILALTATATKEVRKDIIQSLGIPEQNIFVHSIRRPNLAISVADVYGFESKFTHIQKWLKEKSGPVVVYLSLIQSIYELGKLFEKNKLRYDIYHGDLNEKEKKRVQEKFLLDNSGVLLATPAFGLGIDKPNIRAVFHAETPGSIEAYFQEIGRGGRDGQPTDCIFLYDEDDVSTQMEFIKWSNPDSEFILRVVQLIKRNSLRFQQEGADFLRQEMNFYNSRDFRVETSLNLLESWGILDGHLITGDPTSEMLNGESRKIRFKKQNEKLLQLVQYLNSDECRMQKIHDYFAEPLSEPCGICDNCMSGE